MCASVFVHAHTCIKDDYTFIFLFLKGAGGGGKRATNLFSITLPQKQLMNDIQIQSKYIQPIIDITLPRLVTEFIAK